MTTPTDTSADDRPPGRPVWIAAGFIAAFAATVATVVLTGLFVRAPDSVGGGATTDAAVEQSGGSEPAAADAGPSEDESDAPRAAQ